MGLAKWGAAVQSRDEQYGLKRQALIREAARAFGRRGFHSTSLDDVAQALNVTKPALYYYVQSKHELLYECHMLALNLGDEALAWGREQGRTGLERLCLFLRRYIELLAGEAGVSAMLQDHAALRPEDKASVQARRVEVDRVLRTMVADGIADGSIRACNPKMAVFWFMGAVNGISRWYNSEGPQTGSEIAETFVSFIAQGLGSSAPASRGGGLPTRIEVASEAAAANKARGKRLRAASATADRDSSVHE